MNIIAATSAYEAWLREITDVQERALKKKHAMMREGPFPFLRATFYRWVELWEKTCPELHSRDEDVLLAVGDLHLENFGMWLDSRRRLVWGINDFDEACEMPFTNDLVRLAASIALAADVGTRRRPVPVSQLLLTGYREGLEAGGVPILAENGSHPELKDLLAAVKEPEKFWKKKLGARNNPQVDAGDLPRRLKDIFDASFSRGVNPQYRAQRAPGGLGSLGRRRFTAVVGKAGTREAREAKALVPSAFYWREKRAGMPSQLGTLLQRAIRSPDPFLQIHDRWLVRRIAPDAVKIDLPKTKNQRRLALSSNLVRLMGFEAANIHLGSRAPEELLQSLDKLGRKLGSRWLEHATARMVAATRRDHVMWRDAKM